MTAVEPKHDFSACPEKQLTRLANLQAARQLKTLWDRRTGRLVRDWLELTGENDRTLQMLLNAGVLDPSLYWGVNGPDDPEGTGKVNGTVSRGILTRNADLFSETDHARWVHGRLEKLLISQPERFSNVGVVVADGFYKLGNRDLVPFHAPIFRFCREQAKKLGQCLLITNVQYRGQSGFPVEEALDVWTRALARSCGAEVSVSCHHEYKSRSWPMLLSRVVYEAGT